MTTQRQRFILEKLGEAIYTHKKLAQRAVDAQKAVTYLAGKGVFRGQNS